MPHSSSHWAVLSFTGGTAPNSITRSSPRPFQVDDSPRLPRTPQKPLRAAQPATQKRQARSPKWVTATRRPDAEEIETLVRGGQLQVHRIGVRGANRSRS